MIWWLHFIVLERHTPKNIDLDMKNIETLPTKQSIIEPQKLELKALPSHLRYVFQIKNYTLKVMIVAGLNEDNV